MTDNQMDVASVPVPALREELERLRLIHSFSQEFGSSLDFDELLPKVFDSLLTAVGAQGGSIWIAEGDQLRCQLAMGAASQKQVGTTVPIGAGFVGDVAKKQRSTIVAEAMRDPRFDLRVDRSSTMITTTVMAAPMVAKGETVGAIQVTNKHGGADIFDDRDRQVLEGLADAAAIALRNAQLHGAEKRARDLALLLDISREITSTLDLDRVLLSVVNQAARALTFDVGAVGLYEGKRCEIRALAGEEQVDGKSERAKRLAARGAWVIQRGETLYLKDVAAAASDAERAFLASFGADLAASEVRSGLYTPLKDEEGAVGVLIFEAAAADFASDTQRELAAILANQTAVALRNAQLYNQVPLVDALGAIAARKRAFMRMPRARRGVYVGGAVALLAGATLVRWPLRVAAYQPRFRAGTYSEVRALMPGIVERVYVREGAAVARGDPLVQLRDAELKAQREAEAAEATVAERSAAVAASRGDVGAEELQRTRAAALRQALAVLDAEVAAMTVRAPVSGVVLTPRPEELVGARLDAGAPVLALGRTDTLTLEFGVEQRDIGRVAPGQPVHLRVDAVPQRTFEGRVTSLGQLPLDSASDVHFPVRASVPDPEGLLKPGMAAYARVLTSSTSLVGRLVRGPARWLRMTWWRLRP